MKIDKGIALKTAAIMAVMLTVLSGVVVYLILRGPEETIGVMPPIPGIGLSYPISYDEWNIVEWSVVTATYAKYDTITWELRGSNGSIIAILRPKVVSLDNFTVEKLKNDTEYQLYVTNPNSTEEFVDPGDRIMAKSPIDGYYILCAVWSNTHASYLTPLTKF